jgi:hypothetical protein
MSQAKRLLAYLQSGKSITRLEGWDTLGIIELPARCCELRQSGYNISTEMVKVTNRYGETVNIAKWRLHQ